jgi:hypothetical protein
MTYNKRQSRKKGLVSDRQTDRERERERDRERERQRERGCDGY